MNNKTLAALNLLALVLMYLGFIPYNSQIAQVLIVAVAIILLIQK
jgi:UDP-N-acetylmuramyl pentapeptide phosphotransferase/UDP-N-acetylglucosamine-1-phosphate transferase